MRRIRYDDFVRRVDFAMGLLLRSVMLPPGIMDCQLPASEGLGNTGRSEVAVSRR